MARELKIEVVVNCLAEQQTSVHSRAAEISSEWISTSEASQCFWTLWAELLH